MGLANDHLFVPFATQRRPNFPNQTTTFLEKKTAIKNAIAILRHAKEQELCIETSNGFALPQEVRQKKEEVGAIQVGVENLLSKWGDPREVISGSELNAQKSEKLADF